MQAESRSQIETSDLISDADFKAAIQHDRVLELEELTTLSKDEVVAIRGGLKIKRSDRIVLLESPVKK